MYAQSATTTSVLSPASAGSCSRKPSNPAASSGVPLRVARWIRGAIRSIQVLAPAVAVKWTVVVLGKVVATASLTPDRSTWTS